MPSTVPPLPGLTETVLLRADPRSAAEARRLTARLCKGVGLPADACDTALLLVSETVTNAVIHGRSEVRLTVSARADGLRVEVADDNSRHPVLQEHDVDALDGRGVGMLEVCATAWGVRPDPVGKVVWFEVAAS